MNFVSTRILTDHVERLTAFYEQVAGTAANRIGDVFAELHTDNATLAIGRSEAVEQFAPGASEARHNRSVIIEFLVDDVDADYARLRDGSIEIVLVPTTMPWGNRSMLLRDPDGNLVNLFAPVTPETQAQYVRFAAPDQAS